MLQKLTVKNYALIHSLEIPLSGGLNIITGETGAGKSIILGALSLILGERATSTVLFDEKKKCVVEGLFKIDGYNLQDFFEQHELDYDPETIIRRELSPSGKSRAFVNDTPVNLDVLKPLGALLVNLHSQHETLALNSSEFQLSLVDAVSDNTQLLAAYRAAFSKYKTLNHKFNELTEQANSSLGDLDYLKFQAEELETANLDTQEYAGLEDELNTLEHAEGIQEAIQQGLSGLQQEGAIVDQLGQVLSMLRGISSLNEELKTLYDRLDSMEIELNDIARELEHYSQGISYNPERIAEVNDRITIINRLLTKHQVKSVEELVSIKQDIDQRLLSYNNVTAELEELEKEIVGQRKVVTDLAEQLYQSRQQHIPALEQKVVDGLTTVGMPNAQFSIEHLQLPFEKAHHNGIDQVRFLFSANKGIPVQELRKVASGGELSRLMLVLKSLSAKHTALPTLIFDEIDTGISGEVASKVGRVMEELGGNHQVIAITHLPQIASRGNTHYFVYKDIFGDKTTTQMRRLDEEERTQEIAKMLGGDNVTEAAVENARDLLYSK